MLEQNIYTLSHTSTFTLLKPCDNRILSHFLMGFLYHYTTILHMLSTFFFPFFPPKPAPLHSWQTSPCTRCLQSWRTGRARAQVTALKYFTVFAKGDFCKSFFLPGWMFRQRSKKILDQSYQEEQCCCGVRKHKGRNGKWKHYLQQVWLHQSFELCRKRNFISVLPFILFHSSPLSYESISGMYMFT